MKIYKILGKFILVLVLVFVLWYIITLIYTPLIKIFTEAFFINSSFSFDTIKTLFGSERVLKSLLNTFIISIITVIFVNILAIFQIAVLEYYDIKFSKILKIAYYTPLVYGGVSLVMAYKFAYSPYGLVTQMIIKVFPNINSEWFVGFFAVLIVHILSLTFFHILFVNVAFKKIDFSIIEASKNLGASSFKTFIKVALPLVMPSLLSATILVFLQSLGSNAAPTFLGGKEFYMINTMIRNLNSIGRQDIAALLSLILGISTMSLLLLFRKYENKKKFFTTSKASLKIKKIKIENQLLNLFINILAWILFIIYLLPILIILIYSFSDIVTLSTQSIPKLFTIENYIRVLNDYRTFEPILNSFKISFIGVSMALIVGISSAFLLNKYKNRFTSFIEFSLLIPWLFPPVIFAMGMLIAYNKPNILTLNNILIGSYWLLPFAYSILAVHIVVSMIRAILKNINSNIDEVARSLGAGNLNIFFRVILPIIAPTILSVAVIAFNSFLSEYTVSELLYSVNNKPLGVAFRSEFSNPSNYQTANILVYIVLLIVISSITIFITNKMQNYFNGKKIDQIIPNNYT